MERTNAAEFYEEGREVKMKNRLHNPCTTCAEYDFWNKWGRYVKRGSKGIALVVYDGDRPKLRYVFDVSDTSGRRNARPVKLWTNDGG